MQRLSRVLSHLSMNPTTNPTTTTTASPPPTLDIFNALPAEQLHATLLHLCASTTWATKVIQQRPYANLSQLISQATTVWYSAGEQAWHEAFAGHGKLGVKTAEQTNAMQVATNETVTALQHANNGYEQKHQHKCITFAAGKSSERLLNDIVTRTDLPIDEELRRCAEQTMLITALRMCRLVHSQERSQEDGQQGTTKGNESTAVVVAHQRQIPSDTDVLIVSPLTTHVLDTSTGKPAHGLTIRMERRLATASHSTAGAPIWEPVATGITNKDGRVTDLLPGFYDTEHLFLSGVYRLTFDIEIYYDRMKTKCFYPTATIVFRVDDPTQHYHVPLLLNPYGYSTYRGS